MNQAFFVGRLGRDAELRYTGAGKAVSNFSIAVDVGWGDKKHTLWVSCTLWEKAAESLTPFLTKGKQVAVSGQIDMRTYTNRNEEKQTQLTLNVKDVALCGGGERRQADGEDTTEQPAHPTIADDDIPF